ncbi:MAG: carbohydrate-binding domain-containing protein [Bacilli bacterium]|nr:carbohydrate-binding domain-containing protein [Bacilli bacterium]
MKKFGILLFIIIMILSIGGIIYFENSNNSDDDVSSDSNINYESDTEIDWSIYETTYISLDDEDVSITKGGVYEISGTLDDSNIIINTTDNVKIVLNNATIKSSDGPAIYVASAKNIYIELADGTTNYIEDGSSHDDETLEGAIYSTSDLIFEGTGTLKVNANYQDAIVSNDDLIFESGTYIIDAVDEAIKGKDSVVIYDGNYTITSGGDAIKSTNEEDTSKGYIIIEKGTFVIKSDTDGISAVTEIFIYDGNFDITTGGGSSINSSSSNSGWGTWGNSTSTTESSSAKSIKAGTKITIENGKFNINSSDDAIHSNSNVWIKNGTFDIASGDDGIHADDAVLIDNGTITVTESYEGIEGTNITINAGTISVTTSDDGLNAGGGNDSSAVNRTGATTTSSSSSSSITINGGTIYINSTGDGLDANGSITMTGGVTVVNGPTDNGNGALDYDSTFVVTVGTLIASGSSGMAQLPSSSSSIYSVMINFTSSISAGTLVSIKDSSGNEVITYEASKNYQNLVIVSPSLTKDTYTISTKGSSSNSETNGIYEIGGYSGGTNYSTFTINSINTTVGTSSSQMRR